MTLSARMKVISVKTDSAEENANLAVKMQVKLLFSLNKHLYHVMSLCAMAPPCGHKAVMHK